MGITMRRTGIRTICFCVAAVLLAGCGTSRKAGKAASASPVKTELAPELQRKYDYYFLEATRQKTLKNYDAAFDLLQHCLTLNPNASSALYEQAQYYIFLKQLALGQAALEKAVENDPENYWYSQGLANFYQQQNETDKAVQLWESMSVRFTDKSDPLYALMDLYTRAENYPKVISTLNRLEERTGKNEQLTMEKFRIYRQMKDNDNAFREIESLVAEYPMDTRYQVVLGDAYLQNDRKDEAYAVYRKVLDAEPDNAVAMYSMATYYEETGQQELYRQQLESLLLNKKVEPEVKVSVMRVVIMQNEKADGDSTRIIGLFDRLLEQDSESVEIPMLYAQYLLSKNMNEAAQPVLQLVLNIDPENTAARMTLLGDAVKKEDYAAVISLCETGIETNPDMLEFYFYLAIAYNQAERTDDVIVVCQKALEQVTANSKKEVVSDFYAILGDAYHTRKQSAEAYAAYDSALAYNPANIGTLNNYAYYLSIERRDLDKAEEMSYKTVKAEPNNATYLDTYAWILFEKGNYAEARLYIDNAMKNGGGESDVVVEHCGDIYYMTGDTEGALKYWRQALEMGSESDTLKQKIKRKKFIPAD